MRLTCKTFLAFCNSEFERLEITDYVCTSVERTHFTEDQYQGGAHRLRVYFKRKEEELITNYFMCFYSLGEYMDHIKAGYKMYLMDDGRHGLLKDFTIELKKSKLKKTV